LCKNYHPDKLPPDMPEGARNYISARMVLINEAYETLKEDNSRREYDLVLKNKTYNSSTRTQKHHPEKYERSSPSREISDLFEKSILESALNQLEYEERQIDLQLKKEISSIEKKYSHHLKTMKHHIPGSLDVTDVSRKLEKSIVCGGLTFAGLWLVPLGGILTYVGWLLIIIFGSLFIHSILLPVYRPDFVSEVRQAKEQRDSRIFLFKKDLEDRINHFKCIPIYSINYDFVAGLSPKDRLLLVKALKQREDAHTADKSVQSTLKVVAALGLLAVFLGMVSN
ncbi:MAG TPA: hypothetical protein V6D19_03760, partial [Stenomitos sp.]